MAALTALQSGTSAAQNLATGVTVQGYTATAGFWIVPIVRLSGLNGAAASFTVAIRNTTDTKTVHKWSETKDVATDTAADILCPAFVAQSKTYAIKVSSTNASDTSVGVTVDWYDATKVDLQAVNGEQVTPAETAEDIAEELRDLVEVNVISPASPQHLDIWRADAYANSQASGRKLTFTKAASETHWPSSISTVHLNIVPTAAAIANGVASASQKLENIAGTVSSSSEVYFELTSSNTDDLAAGANAYRFTVVANKDTSPATLRGGTCTIRPDASVSA